MCYFFNFHFWHLRKKKILGGKASVSQKEMDADAKVGVMWNFIIIWVVVSNNLLFSPPKIGEDSPNLTIIFFRWVGEKPPTIVIHRKPFPSSTETNRNKRVRLLCSLKNRCLTLIYDWKTTRWAPTIVISRVMGFL